MLSGGLSKVIRNATLRVLVLCFAFTAPASAEILFLGDFETGKIDPLGSGQDGFFYGAFGPGCTFTPRSYSDLNDNRVVKDFVRYGRYANAQTINYTCDYRPLNENKYQKPRQEVGITPKVLTIYDNRDYWLGFSFALGTDWVYDTNLNKDNLFQLFKMATDEAPNARDGGAAALFLTVVDDQFEFGFANDDLQRFRWPARKGEWQDLVLHFKMCRVESCGTNGILELYLNGSSRPVFIQKGVNTKSNEHKLAFNLYKPQWHCRRSFEIDGVTYDRSNYQKCLEFDMPTRSTKPRTVYFDEIRVGDARSSISEVAPYFYSAPGEIAPPGAPDLEIN